MHLPSICFFYLRTAVALIEHISCRQVIGPPLCKWVLAKMEAHRAGVPHKLRKPGHKSTRFGRVGATTTAGSNHVTAAVRRSSLQQHWRTNDVNEWNNKVDRFPSPKVARTSTQGDVIDQHSAGGSETNAEIHGSNNEQMPLLRTKSPSK